MFKDRLMLCYNRLRTLLKLLLMILLFSLTRYRSILIIYVKSSNFFATNELVYRLSNRLLIILRSSY